MPDDDDGDRDSSEVAEDSSEKNARARQLLHWATGDRAEEARALADQAGDHVTEADAEAAVERAHGERRDRPPVADGELAGVEDAEAAAAESE